MTRRRFVLWVAMGVGAAGVGVAFWRGSGYVIDPGVAQQLRFFAPWQYLVVRAAGDRILRPEQTDVGLFADRYLAELPAADRRDIANLLGFVEHGAPLMIGRLTRFTALAPEAQDQVLKAIEENALGQLRGGFNVLKAVAYMALYRQDRTWEQIDYLGPIVPRGEL